MRRKLLGPTDSFSGQVDWVLGFPSFHNELFTCLPWSTDITKSVQQPVVPMRTGQDEVQTMHELKSDY